MTTDLKKKLIAFKREFPTIFRCSTAEDHDWLPAFYIRANYFKDQFNSQIAKDVVCGEPYDGGFDAVFANPDKGENEVVIVQSKCYTGAIRAEDLRTELRKIERTLRHRMNRIKSRLAERVKEAFSRAVSEFEDSDVIHYAIDIVTSWVPHNENQRKILETIVMEYEQKMKRLNVSRVTLVFGDKLLERAESWNVERELVDYDEFQWIKKNGCLRHGDSIVVNLRASSLVKVFRKRGKEVLGLNLRYHVRRNTIQKEVDDGIEDTILHHSNEFWYLNNGIMIVCRDAKLNKQNDILELFDYSIVNGGQTTYNIYHLWNARSGSEDDFAVICKIVVVPGIKLTQGVRFAQKIAVSANSQKPIRAASLRANNLEQRKLGAALEDYGIYYVRKDGDKPGAKQFAYRVDIEEVGKLGLCGLLLMPMDARNITQRMFEQPYYSLVFHKKYARLFRDLVVLRGAYVAFRKPLAQLTRRPKWCRHSEEWRIASLGLTFVLSSWAFCIRTIMHTIRWGDLKAAVDEPMEFAEISGDLRGVDRFLSDEVVESWSPEDFNPYFRKLVHIIYDAYCYCEAEADEDMYPDDFLKRRDVFGNYIAPRLRKLCATKGFKQKLKRLI